MARCKAKGEDGGLWMDGLGEEVGSQRVGALGVKHAKVTLNMLGKCLDFGYSSAGI